MSIHINSKHGGTDIVSGEGRRTERLVVTWKAITQDALMDGVQRRNDIPVGFLTHSLVSRDISRHRTLTSKHKL